MVFGDWKSLKNVSAQQGGTAPSLLEPIHEFTLGGRALSFHCYHNESNFSKGQTPEWTEEWIEEQMNKTRVNPLTPGPYADTRTFSVLFCPCWALFYFP